MKKLIVIVVCAGVFAVAAHCQVLLSGGLSYSQNFDVLGFKPVGGDNTWTDNSTLPGWYASRAFTNGVFGPSTYTTYRIGDGTDSSGLLYSFGVVGVNGDQDRALGSVCSSTPRTNAFGVRIRNNTASSVGAVTISYTGEQWRNGGNAATQTLTFSYKTNSSAFTGPLDTVAPPNNGWIAVPALDFVSPTVGAVAAALDGNAPANRTTLPAVVLTGVTLNPGDELFLRWLDIDDAGTDHGLAVDDVTATFAAVSAPLVSTLSASGIGGTSATLNGAANPEGGATTAWFQWGPSAAPAFTNTTSPRPIGSGFGNTNFSQIITGLTPGVSYSFYAVAQSSLGVASDTNKSFTTLPPPGISTLAASGVTAASATLNALASPHGTSTTGWFEWGATTNYGNVTPAQNLGSDPSDTGVNFSQLLSGLASSTTYHFRAVASNSLGIVLGADLAFTTLASPNASLSGLTLSSGALTPTFDSNILSYAASVANSTTSVTVTPTSADAAATIQARVNGGAYSTVASGSPSAALALSVGTNTIDVRVTAQDTATIKTYTITVARAAGPPIVTTLPASAIGATNATLKASINPNGLPTTSWFDWGTTTNYGNTTATTSLPATNAAIVVSNGVTGLNVGTIYHFRAAATNDGGAGYGADLALTPAIFTDINAGLPAGWSGAAWGDYDNDGNLDILLVGGRLSLSRSCQIWRNNGTGFTNINVTLDNFTEAVGAWGDLNNDGFLDIVLVGEGFNFCSCSQTWQGDGMGRFFFGQLGQSVESGAVALGDFDSDGRLNIIMSGTRAPSALLTGNYPNAVLPSVQHGSFAWGDYDNDGRPDLLITGQTTNNALICQVWRNTGSGFTNINAGLPGVHHGSAVWGDYDNDGRLDILLTGATTTNPTNYIAQVWRNTGAGFVNINAGLPGVVDGSAVWGDYDNDGRLDILLSSASGTGSQIWRNTGSGFTAINAGLPTGSFSGAAWGDYDNDGRLDILLEGSVLRNNFPVSNTPPTAPTGLSITPEPGGVTFAIRFSWNAASDAQTPAAGLTYNLRVGTTPGGSDVVGPMAGSDGRRRLPQMGNCQLCRSRVINGLSPGTYYWSVQAVDTAFAGSPFAPEQSFTFTSATNVTFTSVNGHPVGPSLFPGDLNYDGVVSQSELDAVYANYLLTSPWLLMTNVAGLGGTNVTFALSNSTAGAFSVEASTNLADWELLGPAIPRYLFTDTNAPALPQRFYRLRWP